MRLPFRRRRDLSAILGWELQAATERHGLSPGDIPPEEVAREVELMAQEQAPNATTIQEAIERVALRVAEAKQGGPSGE
jgi:hypothetical protein